MRINVRTLFLLLLRQQNLNLVYWGESKPNQTGIVSKHFFIFFTFLYHYILSQSYTTQLRTTSKLQLTNIPSDKCCAVKLCVLAHVCRGGHGTSKPRNGGRNATQKRARNHTYIDLCFGMSNYIFFHVTGLTSRLQS